MRWSSAGPYGGMKCVQLLDPSDPHSWNDNYLCFDRDYGFRWSSAGPVGGMKHCVQIKEDADPDTWQDNYLCSDKDYGLQWSQAGELPGMNCTRVNEPAEPADHYWNDNFLCRPR